jgi:pimeloyl-ACP methyl ester carboxylesterase
MADFVLIHGACHRAGVWRAVLPVLASFGHAAHAVSLQGNTMAEHAAGIVASAPKGAILVGHSAGGFIAHAAALAARGRFAGVIYLCAFIPSADKSVADLRRAAPHDALGPAIRRVDGGYGFNPDMALGLFFNGCRDPAAHLAGLRTDPMQPVQTALPDLPPSLPRAAIICDDDRAISPAYQMLMAAGIALRRHLPCGHAPFFAAPDLLAQSLHDLADMIGRR